MLLLGAPGRRDRDGAGTIDSHFITNYPSSVRQRGRPRRDLGHDLADGGGHGLHRARRRGTAIYLEEYADRDRWYNRAIEVNIQNLAAVPSIVYGILGLAFLVRGPLSLGTRAGRRAHAGPAGAAVVIIAGREAIRAVPPSIREGSMALGATQWQTIWRQVLPAAIPGIATGVILALSRAIGETAPLIVVGAATVRRVRPGRPRSTFTALPIQIFDWVTRPSNDVNDFAARCCGNSPADGPAGRCHERVANWLRQSIRAEVVGEPRWKV